MNPINFKHWLDDNRALLKPPVGNKLIFEDSEFIVMAVGGPNQRSDFHVDVSEEIFYQVEGNMVLRIIEDGKIKDLSIAEGEMFLLPSNVPHSPQRFSNTVGIVIERVRQPEEQDGFQWYCENCGTKIVRRIFAHQRYCDTIAAGF